MLGPHTALSATGPHHKLDQSNAMGTHTNKESETGLTCPRAYTDTLTHTRTHTRTHTHTGAREGKPTQRVSA